MSKKVSFIKEILEHISYKDKKKIKEFYIPTADELKNYTNNTCKPSESSNVSKKIFNIESQTAKSNNESQKNKNEAISSSIEENIKYINLQFNSPTNKDIVIRCFMIADKSKAFIAYLDGMVDKTLINNSILHPLLNNKKLKEIDNSLGLDFILFNVLETNQAKKILKLKEVIYEILLGNTLLYVDGCEFYISNETKGFPARGVEKPAIEGVVTGAQEAFNENLRTNVSLVRKIIKNADLTTEFLNMGERNQNQCAIMYLNGLTNPAIIDEVKRRISSLEIDYNAGDGMLEQLIEDNSFSIIPTILTTERPDRTAPHIVEGRVAILCEGVPFAKIVPITISALFHSPEDAFMRYPYGTLLRYIRIFGIFTATLLPALYIALTNFHQEMIPTDLLIAIAKAKENVPFPTVVEVVLMEISFELIREAGIRVPGIIGNTLGIIGALILGQAAVTANIVSPVLIIIVAVTGLGNFSVPNFNFSLGIRILRFGFIMVSAILGFYGITCLIMLLGIYFVSLKSFGVPFFAPISPKTSRSQDLIIRHPIWEQEERPDILNALDKKRQPKISRKWTRENPNYTDTKEENDD